MKVCPILLFLVICNFLSGQNRRELEELFANKDLTDSVIIDSAFHNYAPENASVIDSLIELYDFSHSPDLNQKVGEYYLINSNYDQALVYFHKALRSAEKDGDTAEIISITNASARCYRRLGQMTEAISLLESNIKRIEQSGNNSSLVYTLLQLAYIYRSFEKEDKAMTLFEKALKVSKTIGDDYYLDVIYNEIGNFYAQEGLFDKALEMQYNSLELRKNKPGKEQNLLSSYNDLGNTYQLKGELSKAQKMYEKALLYANKEYFSYEEAVIVLNIGSIQHAVGNYNDALRSLKYADSLAVQNGFEELRSKIILSISGVYRELGDFEQALNYHYIATNISNTVQSSQNAAMLEELNAKYQSAEKDKEIIAQEARINRQKLIILFSALAFFIVVFFLFFVMRLLQQKRKAYYQLELKNKETEEQREEIETQRNEIATQRDRLSDQQKHIIDSLNYARHIQNALLPSAEVLGQLLPHFFLFYKPLEIVSGDFYQVYEKSGITYVVIADCTGHGVPGAFMSLLGISALNDIMASEKIFSAKEILEVLRKEIKETLNQEKSRNGARDGLDIGVLAIDFSKKEATYAGARHSLIRISDGQVFELKGDKQPIGVYEKERPFTENHFKVSANDILYLYTDGYIDQFGGEHLKKFMKKRFVNLLGDISNLSMEEQKFRIEKEFDEWKGNHDQIDDVTVLGLNVSE